MFRLWKEDLSKSAKRRMRKEVKKSKAKKKLKNKKRIRKIVKKISSKKRKSIFKSKLQKKRIIKEKKENNPKNSCKIESKTKKTRFEKKLSFEKDISSGVDLFEEMYPLVYDSPKNGSHACYCDCCEYDHVERLVYLNQDEMNEILLSNELNQSFHNQRNILVPLEMEEYDSNEVLVLNKRMERKMYRYGERFLKSGYLFVKKIDNKKKIIVFGTDLRIYFYNYSKDLFYKKNPIKINKNHPEFDPYTSYCFTDAFDYCENKFISQEKWFEYVPSDNEDHYSKMVLSGYYSLSIWNYSKGFENTVLEKRIFLRGFKLASVDLICPKKCLFLCKIIYYRIGNYGYDNYPDEDFVSEDIVIAEITPERFTIKKNLSVEFNNFSLYSYCLYNTNSLAILAGENDEEYRDYIVLFEISSGRWEKFEFKGISFPDQLKIVYANDLLYLITSQEGQYFETKVVMFDLLKKEIKNNFKESLGGNFEAFGYSKLLIKDVMPINNSNYFIFRIEDSIFIWDSKYQRVLFENLNIFSRVEKEQYYYSIHPLCNTGNSFLIYQRFLDFGNDYNKNIFSTIKLFDTGDLNFHGV